MSRPLPQTQPDPEPGWRWRLGAWLISWEARSHHLRRSVVSYRCYALRDSMDRRITQEEKEMFYER